MNVERIQEIFNAVRLHYTSNYDFQKYNGKTRVKLVSNSCAFLGRKLEDEQHVIYYMVANQLYFHSQEGRFSGHLPEIVNDNCMKVYEVFIQRLRNASYNLAENLESFFAQHDLKDLTNLKLLVQLYHTKKMGFLTIVQVYKFMKVREAWNNESDPLAQDFLTLIVKTAPFLNFKKEKFLQVLSKTYKAQYN